MDYQDLYGDEEESEDEVEVQEGDALILTIPGKPPRRAFEEKKSLLNDLFDALKPFRNLAAMRTTAELQLSSHVNALFSPVVLKAVVGTNNAPFIRFVLTSSSVFQPDQKPALLREGTTGFYELFALACQSQFPDSRIALVGHACEILCPSDEETKADASGKRKTLTVFFDEVVRIACNLGDREVLDHFLAVVVLVPEAEVYTKAWYRPCVFNTDLMTALCVTNSPVFDPEFASPSIKRKRECLSSILAVKSSVLPRSDRDWCPEFDDHPMVIAVRMEDAHVLMELALAGIDVNLPFHPKHGPLVIYCAKFASDLLLCQLFTVHNLNLEVTDATGNGLLRTLLFSREVKGSNLVVVLQTLLYVSRDSGLDIYPTQWKGHTNAKCVSLLEKAMDTRIQGQELKRRRGEQEEKDPSTHGDGDTESSLFENGVVALGEDEEYEYEEN